MEAMVQTPFYGLYNQVCGGDTGRLEVATELVRELGLTDRIKLEPVPSDFFSKDYFAPRPPCERLVNYKLNLRGMNLMRDWRVSLKEYLADYYADAVLQIPGAKLTGG
jgi:dTDP-4-dehydrorhamnose reductase